MPVNFTPQIPFVEQQQQASDLCWIALAVSVKRHFTPTSTMRQCGLVKTLLNLSGTCCTSAGGVQKKCDKPGQLEEALGHPSVDHLAPDSPRIRTRRAGEL